MHKKTTTLIRFSMLIASMTTGLSTQAALISYTDETTWSNTVGVASGTENFDSFTTDTTFQNTTISVNNMQITCEPGSNGQETNKIDTERFYANSVFTSNDTSYLLGDLFGSQTIRVDFDTAVTAWGADFRSISNPDRNTAIHVYDVSDNLLGTLETKVGGVNSFYGFSFDANEMAKYLVFENTGTIADSFGMDNVKFVTKEANVAEPLSIGLLGLGFAGIGFARRKPLNT